MTVYYNAAFSNTGFWVYLKQLLVLSGCTYFIDSLSCSSEDNKIFKYAVIISSICMAVFPVLALVDMNPYWGANCNML